MTLFFSNRPAVSRWVTGILSTLSRSLHLLCGIGPCCRYQPTCTEYSRQAITTHGVAHGLLLTGRRLLRCHPFGDSGWDPVPDLRARKPHGF